MKGTVYADRRRLPADGQKSSRAVLVAALAAATFAGGYITGMARVTVDSPRVLLVDASTFGPDFSVCVDAPEAAAEYGINCIGRG